MSPVHAQDLIRLIAAANDHDLTDAELGELNEKNQGWDRAVGIEYTALGPKGATATVTVRDDHHQPVGLVNGGVYASIGESLGSLAGSAAAGSMVVGMNNSCDFFRSVREGVIEAVARPVHLGRTTQLWQIDMTHEGRLVARDNLRTAVVPSRT